jgi:hypothetical protein
MPHSNESGDISRNLPFFPDRELAPIMRPPSPWGYHLLRRMFMVPLTFTANTGFRSSDVAAAVYSKSKRVVELAF